MQNLTIVFDLDGTLIDTAPDLVGATNHVLAAEGLVPVTDAQVRPYVSFGARRMIERGLELRGALRSIEETDRMLEVFLAFYANNIAVRSRPYPLLEATLSELAASGARLAVCTNKRENLSRKLLDALGLSQRFAAICGSDTFTVRKPHPDHLIGTIKAAGGDASRAIMVGDSDVDVCTAKAAGIPIIGVSFGYTDIPMRDLGPDALIDHYSEFRPELDRLRNLA